MLRSPANQPITSSEPVGPGLALKVIHAGLRSVSFSGWWTDLSAFVNPPRSVR